MGVDCVVSSTGPEEPNQEVTAWTVDTVCTSDTPQVVVAVLSSVTPGAEVVFSEPPLRPRLVQKEGRRKKALKKNVVSLKIYNT